MAGLQLALWGLSKPFNPRSPTAYEVQRRSRHEEDREIAIEHYGPTCRLCGDDDPKTLTIHHVFEDARAEYTPGGFVTGDYGKYRRSGYPPWRVCICANCHAVIHSRLLLSYRSHAGYLR